MNRKGMNHTIRKPRPITFAIAAAIAVTALKGCGGGGDNGSAPPPAPSMTGTLSAPNGALAFNAPTGVKRLLAGLFGGNAMAALPGTQPVPGVTVKLIEIDGTGVQVGADIATAVTGADGSFTLNVPTTFVPGPRFVIRAIGAASLDRLVTDLTAQDVDPATQVTKQLVLTQLAGGNIQNLPRLQVLAVSDQVASLVNDVAPSLNAGTLVTDLTAVAHNNQELNNTVGNLTAVNGIAGTVTDSNGAPLANIKVVVRDFNQWVTRAQTFTDASGSYSLNVAAGDYIVGALNFTAESTGASEWWTCDDVLAGHACGAANQFSAAKVSVGAGVAPLNFKLEPGARVEGSMTSAANPATVLPGVTLLVRDFTNDQPVASRDAQSDGTFRINVRPGVYTLSARNTTLVLPYATGLYNGSAAGGTSTSGGGATAAEATPMVLAAGSTTTVNFPLVEGGVVQGRVTDGALLPPNDAVTGISVRFNKTSASDATGAFVDAVRTDLNGEYRMWVRPGTYAVRSRGQTATPTVVGFGANNAPAAVNFGATVGRATATLLGPNGAPLSQVKVFINDSTTNTTFVGSENTNSDGTVEVYAALGSYHLTYQVDSGSTAFGTAIENGTANPTAAQLQVASLVAFDPATLNALGTRNLPAGGELKGVVTLGGAPTGNLLVQVRIGGTGGGGARFATTRTSKDGSYSISVPAATYSRACAFVVGTVNSCPTVGASAAGQYAPASNGNTITVTANQSNTFDIAIP